MTTRNETRIMINLNSLTEDESRITLVTLYSDMLRMTADWDKLEYDPESPVANYPQEIDDILGFLSTEVFSSKTDNAVKILNRLIGSDYYRECILLIDLDTPIMRMIDYMP